MIDRKKLSKGDVVWFAELTGTGRVVCWSGTVRAKPRGRSGVIWLTTGDGRNTTATEWRIYPSEEVALRSLLSGAQEVLEGCLNDVRAAERALAEYETRRAASVSKVEG